MYKCICTSICLLYVYMCIHIYKYIYNPSMLGDSLEEPCSVINERVEKKKERGVYLSPLKVHKLLLNEALKI